MLRRLWQWWRSYILHQKDCDNCVYCGGLCQDHTNKHGECLGWHRKNVSLFGRWCYERRMRKLIKEIQLDQEIMTYVNSRNKK